jgi:putative hemolysin
MAVDHSGDVYTFDGTRWSKAGAAGSSNSPLKLVCTSAKFCVAADTNGDFARYNGSAWTVSSSVFTGADALSSGTDLACAGQTCVAVTGGDVSMASTFAGGRWSRQVTVDRSGQLNAISCPATGFCAATGYSADAVTRHDGTWAPPVRLPDGAAPLYLSWTSATFCLAGDDVSGRIWRYNGISWTTAPSVPGAVTFLTALSCVNRSFCVAAFLPSAEKSSGLATYNGTRWTAVKPFDANNLWSVNCPSAKFCAAVGSGSLDGGTPFAAFNGKTWTARASVRYAHGKGAGDGIVPALSCTSATFCAMSTLNLANDVGVTTFNGKTWTLKTLFRGDNTTTVVVSGLSCAPGGKACVAALTNGRIFTFDGTDWSGPGNSGRVNLEYGGVDVAVSCASPKFCAAAQGNGYVSIGT